MKIGPVEADLFHADGHDEAKSRFPQFRVAPKNSHKNLSPCNFAHHHSYTGRQLPTRVVQHTQLPYFGSLHGLPLCLAHRPRRAAPRRAAASTPLLIDARSVKPTVVTLCPDNDSAGRNNWCWPVLLHFTQNMFSTCTVSYITLPQTSLSGQ